MQDIERLIELLKEFYQVSKDKVSKLKGTELSIDDRIQLERNEAASRALHYVIKALTKIVKSQ